MTDQTAETSRFIGSANHGFAQYAIEEVRRLFPQLKFTYLEPGEVFLLQIGAPRDAVIASLNAQEPIFLRHIQPVDTEWEIDRTRGDLDKAIQFLQAYQGLQAGEKVAVQVRKAAQVKFDYTPYGVKEAIDPILEQELHVEPVVRHADKMISIYLTADRLYVGLSRPADNLSDWNGGMVRYQKEEGQVSRAKFKLLEAEERFGLRLRDDHFHRALDIGAAPGGWTSLLLERGLTVTAVDPGELHASLLQEPRLTYLRKKADEVAFEEESFDLLVCDMSWSPRQMAKLVADLLPALKTGGTAIITVKLMHKKPFQTVRETMAEFGDKMELVQAKQLFHNREELTLYVKKQAPNESPNA